MVLVLVLGGQVLVLVLAHGGQVLVLNCPGLGVRFLLTSLKQNSIDKNILCGINNIQSYKLVFCVQYFLYLLFLVHRNHRCLYLYLRIYRWLNAN